jgi:hypothetical protein
MSAKRELDVHASPGHKPESEGLAEKDRPIDPTSGKNSPAWNVARTGFEPDGKSGRAPALHASKSISPSLPLKTYPFRFAHARRMRPLSVGRVTTPFIQQHDHHSMIHIHCKAIAEIWLIGNGGAGAYRAGGQRFVPLLVGRLCRSTKTLRCSPFLGARTPALLDRPVLTMETLFPSRSAEGRPIEPPHDCASRGKWVVTTALVALSLESASVR